MKKLRKLDFKFFAIILIIMMIIFGITRYALSYLCTPEWVARHLFSYILSFLIVMSLIGYRKFVTVLVIGYISGLLEGELFGGFESHIGPQYLHWGWLIFIIVFVVSCFIGYIIENKCNRNKN